ncbi:MAG: insulinase family protein, partial [Alphaproteobacteria bacterium]|nr:insulinase family protein [Alphaproteobacteria bacterium]
MAATLFAIGLFAAPPAARAARQGQSILRATLQNGLQVVIVRNTLAPVVTTVMNYKVGSDEAPEGFPGMAHAQEHMMFRGSPGLDANQLADISAGMGGQFDADTTQTMTQFFFTVPTADMPVALRIAAIRMRGVLDTDALWDNERRAIEQEVAQDLSNPEYVLYTKLLAAMFRGTPYAHDALGTKASFDKTTGAMLHGFYDRWYAPNNAVLVIVGDVDPKKALVLVKALFGSIPARTLPPRPAFAFGAVSAATLDLKTDLPYGLSALSFRMPGSDSPDFAAAKVLADVLDSQRGSLYALVPAGKALFAGFSLSSLPKASLGYAIAGFPKNADGKALAGAMRNILAEDVKNGVPAGLVAAAKRRALAEAEFQKNSVSGLAMAWSDALAEKGWRSPEDGAAAIQKVTVAEVNRVARAYLSGNGAITAILTPQVSGRPVSSKSYGGQETFAPRNVKAVTLPLWAETALKNLSIPEMAIRPVTTVLPNGIRLIVQPESVSDTVSVYGHIKNNAGLEAPHGQDGIDEELDQLFPYGTDRLGRVAFQKALDDIGAVETAGTDFSLTVPARDLERGVRLLAGNELHPALPEKAFAVTRAQLAATVAGRLQSPDYLSGRALLTALFPKADPTLRQATPATVSGL